VELVTGAFTVALSLAMFSARNVSFEIDLVAKKCHSHIIETMLDQQIHRELMAARDDPSFPDRARFMGYAARVMRGLIIDHARSRSAIKRGGEFEITSLGTDVVENPADAKELSLISDALDELAKVEAELAAVVDLKFFCGFSFAEIAAMQKLSERTVQRRWEKARIYLHRSIRAELSF